MSTAVHRSPNKRWRSYSIFDLYEDPARQTVVCVLEVLVRFHCNKWNGDRNTFGEVSFRDKLQFILVLAYSRDIHGLEK
jgi:hypothetical protein